MHANNHCRSSYVKSVGAETCRTFIKNYFFVVFICYLFYNCKCKIVKLCKIELIDSTRLNVPVFRIELIDSTRQHVPVLRLKLSL